MTAVHVILLFAITAFVAWRILAWKPKAKPRAGAPVPGERWEHLYPPEPRYDGSPWPIPDEPGGVVTVTIRDVRGGWVRFYHGESPDESGEGPRDRRARVALFMQSFTRKPPGSP